MKTFTVPDICDENEDVIIGDLFLKSYGGVNKFFGEVRTVECPHSNSVVKEMVEENGNGKVSFLTGFHLVPEFRQIIGPFAKCPDINRRPIKVVPVLIDHGSRDSG